VLKNIQGGEGHEKGREDEGEEEGILLLRLRGGRGGFSGLLRSSHDANGEEEN
jgi:hypothetical protein